MIKPVNVGPIAGANCITNPASPIANPRCSLENNVNNVNCINGMSIPAPTACITRAIMSTPKLGAIAATIDPIRNVPIAPKYSGLVFTLSIK